MVSTTKVLLSVAVVGGGAGMLIYSSLAEAEYYKHVDEVTLEPQRYVDKSLKVHGFVEPGSIDEQIVGQSTVRTFTLEFKGERIRVRHKGPKPDTFRDLAEVVAQGKLLAEADGPVLEASELMAKCPSKYEEQKRTRAPISVQPASGPAGSSAGASNGPERTQPEPITAPAASSSR
ncbi:MAG TPA: cytochrome c maturation protein CcmE [Kofleriaceae bacterium]|nr:cytochrome c maturation protein CcmE [Kofleriaceae bacterium]